MARSCDVGQIRVAKGYIVNNLKEFVGDREVSGLTKESVRMGVSPYSSFYRLRVHFKDGSEDSVFVKDASVKRMNLIGKVPNGGKLIENEISFLEFGREHSGVRTPRLYHRDSYDDGESRRDVLFLEDWGSSLDSILRGISEDMRGIEDVDRACGYMGKSFEALWTNSKLSSEFDYRTTDNAGNLTIRRTTQEDLEAEIKQALYSLEMFRHLGAGDFDREHHLNGLNWSVDYKVTEIIKVLNEFVAKPLSEDQDSHVLCNLDGHVGNIVVNKRGEVVVIDNARFGTGPKALVVGNLLYHPSVFNVVPPDRVRKLADDAYLQSEKVWEGTADDIDLTEKRRFDQRLPSAARLSLLRVISYVAGLNLYFPDNAKALVESNPMWEPKQCVNSVIDYFVNLDDDLTRYFDVVNKGLRALKINGNH